MEGRCHNCKHWRRGGQFHHLDQTWGIPAHQIERILLRPADASKGDKVPAVLVSTDPKAVFGICLHPSIASDSTTSWLRRKWKAREPRDGVSASCDEERGYLDVGQDFGCIHHEPCDS